MAATDALVFDAIRTPRGKGKFNGSLHGTKPVGHPLHPALIAVPLGAFTVMVLGDWLALLTRAIPSEIGPFALTSYEEAAGWSEMIEEVVRDQRMPPWHADPHFGTFSNDLRTFSKER